MQTRPKPYFVFPGASPDLRFKCKRCYRDLPDTCFRRMIWAEHDSNLLQRAHANALHPICRTCEAQQRGVHTTHPLYTKAADRFFQKLMHSVRGGAKTRRIACFLDKDDLLGLYLEQDGRCAMTGQKMLLEDGPGPKLKNRMRPSIDRIDSSGNYTLDNVQLVCAQVNIMKGGMSQVDFLRWCNRIVSHRGSAEDNILAAVS